jgi:ectoine hydroxylase-related dioxygenase (phytanoyl-CoA dioxygenase family)
MAQDQDARAARHAATDLAVLLREGYVVVEGAVPERLCQAANADLDEFKARNRRVVAENLRKTGALRRVVNLHLVIDSLAAVFSANGALDVCDRFFDAETVLYTSLMFERGSEQDLHRDSPAFVTRPEGNYLGVWAALEDVDTDNGPLVVVPRSHSLPQLDVGAMAVELYGEPANAPATDQLGWDRYQNAVKEQSEAHGLSPVEIHVRRGDVVVWHPLLFHGGAPHRSLKRTRRSLVMHVTPFGVPVYHQDVFFDPDKDVPDTASWEYSEHGGRKIPKSNVVDFAHEYTSAVRLLHRPGAGAADRLLVLARGAKHRLNRATSR